MTTKTQHTKTNPQHKTDQKRADAIYAGLNTRPAAGIVFKSNTSQLGEKKGGKQK